MVVWRVCKYVRACAQVHSSTLIHKQKRHPKGIDITQKGGRAAYQFWDSLMRIILSHFTPFLSVVVV